jgi:tryptophan-rich sensory protein
MIFDVNAATYLVAWSVFVFWDPLWVSRGAYAWYNEKYDEGKISQFGVAPETFGWVWFFLDCLRVVFIYLFMHMTIDVSRYVFITVFVLFVVNELVRKTWSHVFFNLRQPGLALFIALFLWATAVTIVVLVGITDNLGLDATTPDNFKWMIFSFYMLYVLWLTYAVLLNNEWLQSENGGWRFNFRVPVVLKKSKSEVAAATPTMQSQMRHGWRKVQ